MFRPRTLPLVVLALPACLPWADPLVDLSISDGDPTPDATTDLDPTTSAEPDTTSEPDTSGEPFTGCEGFTPVPLSLNVLGQQPPVIAAGPDCRIHAAGVRTADEPCPGADQSGGPAFLADLRPACAALRPLPGDIVHDIAADGDSVVIVGEVLHADGDADNEPMIARVDTHDDLLTAGTPPGIRARAVALVDEDTIVAGGCNEVGEDSLWITRYDTTLTAKVEFPCNAGYGEARALAAAGNDTLVLTGDRDDSTRAYLSQLDPQLVEFRSDAVAGLDPGDRTAAMVAAEDAIYLAVGCAGETLAVSVFPDQDCENIESESGGNVALLRIARPIVDENSLSALVFGGVGGQHPTGLAFIDASTLVMSGTIDGDSMRLSPQIFMNGIPGDSSFVAWFDISDDVPVPTHLMILEAGDAASSVHAHDIAVSRSQTFAERRVLVAGTAKGDLCLRSHMSPDTCSFKQSAEGGQNFLAVLPLSF